MTASWRTLFLLLAISLACCGKSEPAPDPLKAHRNTVQKAKDVNNVVEKAAGATRSKIEDAETK